MGYKITKKENLSAIDFFMRAEVSHVAKSWKPGQLVVFDC